MTTRASVEAWLRGMAGCTVFGPCPVRVAARRSGSATNCSGRAYLHQRRRPGRRARLPGVDRGQAPHQHDLLELDALPRHLVDRRRQLYRARIRADLSALRRRGDGGREGAAADRPRGRGRVGRDPRHPGSAKASRSAWTPNASVSRRAAWISPSASIARRGEPEIVGSHVLLAVGRRPNTDDLGLEAAGVAIDARGYIVVDDELRTNVARHLGARRLQRARRLHPHRLQRFRDRRREPARRRAAPGQRPHPRLRALHRSAARPRRPDRSRGARQGPCRPRSARGR